MQLQKITFEITNRCDLHCRICHIWQEKPCQDMALPHIKKVLAHAVNPVNISLTGGEPTLHPEFGRIYRHAYTLFLKKKIRNIDVATNACGNALVKFLLKHKKYLRPLSLSISIDGIGAVHDAQRGTKGAFNQTIAHIQAARNLHIPVLLKFTASAINYKHFPRVVKLARALKCPLAFKTVEQLPAYYHRQRASRTPLLNNKQRLELLKLVEGCESKMRPHKEFLSWQKKFLKTGRMGFITTCPTPRHALFVTSRGDIYNCLYQRPIATLHNWPASLDTNAMHQHILQGQNGQCPQCLAYHGSLQRFNAHQFPAGAA